MVAERGVISYPIPLYQNLPIDSQFYSPNGFVISAISTGLTTTVTTTEDLNFSIGQQVRLLIPPPYGSRQLNQKTGFVLSIPAVNQVVLDINSQFVDAFIAASSNVQEAQIMPIGDVNGGQNTPNILNSNLNIPGAFVNISPQ